MDPFIITVRERGDIDEAKYLVFDVFTFCIGNTNI